MEANQGSTSNDSSKAVLEGEAEVDQTTPADPLEALQDELKQEKNKYLYLYADFENYKKRAFKERSDLIKFASEPLFRDLLNVKDNLERALQHTDNVDSLVVGLKMVDSELKKTLEKFGLSEVKSIGEKFDPTFHEAVGQENSEQDGLVVREAQKGYSLHGRLVRPARVIVGIKK